MAAIATGSHSGFTAGGNIDMNNNALLNAVSYAEMYMVTPAATASLSGDTYAKIGGTTSAGAPAVDFTVTTTSGGRLTYTGTTEKKFHVNAAISFSSTEASVIATFAVYYYDNSEAGGSIQSKTESSRKLSATPGDVGAFAMGGIVTLDENDYIEVHCKLASVSGTDTITVSKMNITVVEV